MMMIPCLQDRAWSAEEFWRAVNAATDYVATNNRETDKAAVEGRVLENVLFFSRALGSA